MGTPVVTIFVRHSEDCKYAGDEFYKGCRCRKHLRWSVNGKQYRKTAGTRAWSEAEENKRRLEDQLAGRTPTLPDAGYLLDAAVETFTKDKAAQGVKPHVVKMYERELARLQAFCMQRGLYAVRPSLTLENLTLYRNAWPKVYKSSYSRSLVQKRLNNFLRYCLNASWIDRVPKLSPIKIDSPETEPLTEQEYADLLAAVPRVFEGTKAAKIRAIIQLMRWSGLSVRDASTLKRTALLFDKEKGIYKIISTRAKTGTNLYIPVPPEVAQEVIAVLNGNPVYVFWERKKGSEGRQARHAGEDIAKVFSEAGIESEGHMVSHRLRGTFAVDLLQKGVPLEHVSKLLGHRSVTTTERHYAKWIKGRQDLLDNLVSRSWKK